MITTICLNPALDRTVTVDSLVPGQVNRIRQSRTDVGGKGVNVAVVCHRLGLDAQVIGCAGVDGYAKLRAKAQAEEYGHSIEREIGFLTVHSTLHLLGFDHMEEPFTSVMRAREKEIMDIMDLHR